MIRFFLALGAGVCALSLLLVATAEARQFVGTPGVIGPAGGLACNNAIQREIILTYDLSGGTLTGLFHTNLVVYNDGYCAISKRNQVVFPAPGLDVDVQTKSVGAAAAGKLLSKLIQAGAFDACDQQFQVSDVPLKTVSVSSGFTNGRTHSFSFWFDSSGVDSAIQSFIQQHFPGF